MGGKTKQSQRTKNNVRPSSSSRSAGLLSSGVNLDGGLATLSSGKTLPQLFPTLAATNLEQSLNPEFQMCIKKLNKKDPITRAKALQELCELVNSADVNDVVAALPSWAHFYKILSADTDRKVREVTQVCHGSVVRVCGRRVAPQLKMLLPAWLAAQHDPHAPAQAAAHHALKSTFPDSKLPEVITFCKAEVMTHLLDNLIGNAETVMTKRIENAEDRELQMSRIITSSLQGLEYFVVHLPGAHDAWLWTELTPLLQASAFWKLAHAAPQVRAAWYGAVGRVVERLAARFAPAHAERLARALLAGGAPAAARWACLLQLMHHVQNWPEYLDNKELLVKRIVDVLENGGWGDAKQLSNMLLPLLAHLPQDLLTKEFYNTFFKAMFSGLDKKNILNSKSERQAWITSLAECLRYMSIQEHAFVTEITTSVHRHWIERLLSTLQDGQTRTNLIKCSATNMASLVKYWLKQSKEENNEKYDQLVRNFWQNVGSSILIQIDKSSSDEKEIEKLIEGHILLLQTLKTAFAQDSKKQFNIKFDGDEPTQLEPAVPLAPQCDAVIVDRYKHNLDECVHKICSHYLESAEKKQVADPILIPLLTLLNDFDSKNLFTAVARQFNEDSVYKLYEKVLRSWLSGDSMCRKSVVDIVFLLMKYMSEDEQDAMFESFNQMCAAAQEWCVCRSARLAAGGAGAGAGARRWLRGGGAGGTLARLAARAAAALPPPAAPLLLVCLAGAPGEPLVSDAAVAQVVHTFSEAIAHTDSATLETSAALAARLVTTLQDYGALEQYSQLVQNLFRLNILVPRGDVRLSVDTWGEVRSSWQDGLAALPPAPRELFLQQAGRFIHDQLFHDFKDLNITKIENVVSPCGELVWVGAGAGAGGAARLSRQLLARARRAPAPARAPAAPAAPAAAALRHLCLSAQLCCLHHADDDIINAIVFDASNSDADDLTETELVPYVHEVLFRAIYFRTLFLHEISLDVDDDEEADRKTWCDTLLQDEYFRDEFCLVLYDYIVIYFLDEGYTFWPHYDLIQQTKQKMDTLLEDLISVMGDEVRSAVLGSLTERALARGYLWALARRWYLLHAQPAAAHHALPRPQPQTDVACGNGFFHTLQANSKWCSDAAAQYRCKFLVMLHSWHAVHAAALEPAELSAALASAAERCDPDAVINAYYRHNHTMLYDRDISDVPWNEVLSNVTVVEFLTAMVETCGWDAPAHHWDFTTITMCSLLCSLEKSKHNWSCSKVAMLTRSVLRLFTAVRDFVRDLRAECQRRQPAPHVADLMAEWTDIFAPDTHYNLFTIILHVLESCTTMELSGSQQCVVAALSGGVEGAAWEALGGGARAGSLAPARLARAAAAALLRPAAARAKRLAYRLLLRLAAPLVLDDAEKLALWSDDSSTDEDAEHERPEFSLDYFHDAFTQLHEIVEAALGTVVLGETTCEFVATSDSYSMALGWFLLAEIIASVCQLARGDLYHHYLQIYRERKYVEPVLETALRLLPEELFAFASDTRPATPPPNYSAMFVSPPDFSATDAGADVPALACRGVFSALCGPGAGGARGWWGAAPARAARLLERLVRAYVAPAAARSQLRTLQQRAAEIEDAEIRIAWSTNEVTCLYNVEDRNIELRVWLSPAHPLTPPRIAAADYFGPGGNTYWVALYLAYQNGTILNALKMWTQAVSAKVESSPQCYICYCRLHPNTGHLPRVPCHQCKNKFHNMCLRKWFATSNKSNCPLCRSTF